MKSLIALVVLVGSTAFCQSFVISTIAGRPTVESAPALTAIIGPTSITVDTTGNIYFVSMAAVFKLDPSGIVRRIAGLGAPGFSGDGGPAVNAQLAGPTALALDRTGSLYIAESAGRIRKVGPEGNITTIAGDGVRGYSGDGGPATISHISPSKNAMALDVAGNLYFGSDSARIHKISTDGIITTIAGNGAFGYSGDGGRATSASIGSVFGLACDRSDNLYFSDNLFGAYLGSEVDAVRVRRVSPDGVIVTIAGTGDPGGTPSSGDGGPAISAKFFLAEALAVDAAGNLYISDYGRVRRVSRDGIIITVAGHGQAGFSGDGGPALQAQFYGGGLAADADGNLYIADYGNNRVRKISAAGIITTVAGTGQGCCYSGEGGPATQAQLSAPTGIAVDESGAIYVADTFNNRLRKIDAAGVITTIAGTGVPSPGSGDGGPSTRANLYWPTGLKLDGSGNLYFTDTGNMRICRISPGGVMTTVAGVNGWPGYDGDDGPATAAHLSWPKDIAFDATGNLYIADTANHVIRKVSPTGDITTFAGVGGDASVNGGYSGDGGPAASARMNQPSGLAVDSNGNLYVSDTNNFRVRRISASGVITTVAGNGTKGYSGNGRAATEAQLAHPAGLAFDEAGNLYIGDGASVRMVGADGTIRTVAGNGLMGFSGDGESATTAQTGSWGVAFDSAGRLYTADWLNNVVRLLTPVN